MTHVVREASLKTASTPVILLRAGIASLWDRLADPKARVRSDIPWCVNAITKEWLDQVLAPNESQSVVEDISIENHSSGTSVRGVVSVTYNEVGAKHDLPASIFCKSTPTFVTRIANGFSNTMTFEGGFYGQIRPELSLEAPHGIFSACDVKTMRSIHLLEDLVATKGASFCGIDTEVARAEAENIIEVLAALHGRFWANTDLDEQFPWLPSFKDWNERGAQVVNLKKAHERALEVAELEGVLPTGLVPRNHEIWGKFLQSLELNHQLPHTLLHGDVHLGNWYKTSGGSMGLCDWQCVSKGHWGRDLAYALATTLNVNDRRAWEKELVAFYCQRLSECSGVEVHLDDAWLRYRQHLPAALLMWTPTLTPPKVMPEMQPRNLALELVRRITTAIDDLDALDSL